MSIQRVANTKKYEEAKELMNNGSYQEASEIFNTVIEYEDSEDLYKECLYSQGKLFMEDNNYSGAKEIFETISDYNDVSELLTECDHMIAVKNDNNAPEIKGISEGDVLEVKFNEEFNLKDYLNNTVTINDDVTSDIIDYSITTSSDVYDPDSGKISSLKGGTFEFAISASDEAKNKTTVNFSIHVDATLYITKDKDTPIVLYEGDLGRYELISATHYSNWEASPNYLSGYYFDIEFENKAETDTRTSFGRAYLNDYRILVYADSAHNVASGKKGINTCSIYDDDLDEKTKTFTKIECEFLIIDANEKEIFSRPVVMDRDFISFK